jgi:dTDP-4-dehydrorhamnose 3,5-epimerase
VLLSAENNKQLMVPHGFAHGFAVLSATASVIYKVDQVYNKEKSERIRYDDDPTLAIDWLNEIIVSDKVQYLPSFDEINCGF